MFTLGEPWLRRDAEEIRATFPDLALTESLGVRFGEPAFALTRAGRAGR
ncbi:hypothetical protein ACFQU2_05530 [Siccirubricoccus deserti]|uniref:Uncharacterized protein n=1 Tax=Siccirubricoccus deserti TaxID=2013562 RepID=A0A9X0UEP3_9PROT|nr:hypothetical protein [Siccirubricoccus deserti]MBC4018114.1 hypothetical protein [Siccirubricoccus deserti]